MYPEKMEWLLKWKGSDLMDGTPIFDIKPYLPYADCVPDARGGFADVVKNYALEVEIPEIYLSKTAGGAQGMCEADSCR